ncbi:hypothetical protein [Fluviispira vulneris]|uniref:hypothetical protein n=1 Tax=Fluviispira vulneris TaxID=2763012 RepID=UPI001646C26C|nr:hypothetical protein [Fluviispira vulneris]
MTISKSLKLTALGLGLASIAITGCKKNDNNNNASGTGSDKKIDNVLRTDQELTVEIGNGKMRYGGCAHYKVQVKQPNGKLIDVTTVASTAGGGLNLNIQETNVKKRFSLNPDKHEICAVENNGVLNNKDPGNSTHQQMAAVGDKVTLVAKYDGLTGQAQAEVVADAEYADLRLTNSLKDKSSEEFESFIDAKTKLEQAEKEYADADEGSSKETAKTKLDAAKVEFEAAKAPLEVYQIATKDNKIAHYAMKLIPGSKSPLFQIKYTSKVDLLDEKYAEKKIEQSLTSAEDVQLVYNREVISKAKTEIINKEVYFYFDVPKDFGNFIGKEVTLLLEITNKQGEALPNTKVIYVKPEVTKLGALTDIKLTSDYTSKESIVDNNILVSGKNYDADISVKFSHLDDYIDITHLYENVNNRSNGYKIQAKKTLDTNSKLTLELWNSNVSEDLTKEQEAFDTRLRMNATRGAKEYPYLPIKVKFEVSNSSAHLDDSIDKTYYVDHKPVLTGATFAKVGATDKNPATVLTVGAKKYLEADLTKHCAELTGVKYKFGDVKDLDATVSDFNVVLTPESAQYFEFVTNTTDKKEYLCAKENVVVGAKAAVEVQLNADESVKYPVNFTVGAAVESKFFNFSYDGKTPLLAINLKGEKVKSDWFRAYFVNSDGQVSKKVVPSTEYKVDKLLGDSNLELDETGTGDNVNSYRVSVKDPTKIKVNEKLLGTLQVIEDKDKTVKFANQNAHRDIPVTYTK